MDSIALEDVRELMYISGVKFYTLPNGVRITLAFCRFNNNCMCHIEW